VIPAAVLLGVLLALPAAAQQSVVLQRVPAPDTDTIRWADSKRSVEDLVELDEGGRLVRLDRFGRKAPYEVDAALPPAGGLILDLRSNRGGSLRQMLRVAARFTGPMPDAVRLVQAGDIRVLAIPAAVGPVWRGPLTVLVGADTMSSAEVLAALLRRFAGATILGARTFGKDYVLRVEPIGQEWRALVPDGRIEVPDERLAGGLLPDGPIPAALASRIATN
jgi:C-terminal processing protease CtpA/Prc